MMHEIGKINITINSIITIIDFGDATYIFSIINPKIPDIQKACKISSNFDLLFISSIFLYNLFIKSIKNIIAIAIK